MKLLYVIIQFIALIFLIDAVKVSQDNSKKLNKDDNTTDSLTRTDRLRRLIPYMTYYIPTNDYENVPISQMYNYMTAPSPKPLKHNNEQYLQETIKPPPPQLSEYINFNRFQQPHHIRPTVIYKTSLRHQHSYNNDQHINHNVQMNNQQHQVIQQIQPVQPIQHVQQVQPIHSNQPEQQLQTINNNNNKGSLTPFLPSNKVPGGFRPMMFGKDDPNYPFEIKFHRVTPKPDLQDIHPSPRPQYQQYNHRYPDYVPTKYINQENTPPKHINIPIAAQNFVNYIKPTSITKPEHIIYQDRIPQQQYYEPVPTQQLIKDKVPYQVIKTSGEYSMSPEQLESIVQKQVPYYQNQQTNVAKPTVASYIPTHSTPSIPTETPSTAVTPLYRVSTISPSYNRGYNKYIPAVNKVHPYQTTTQPPIQHLTEITHNNNPSQRPYFFQSNGPINLKTIPKYEPIIKPSPPPKIIFTTSKPSMPKLESSSLADILKKLQDSNHLPHTLTPDNIDNSIKTLVKILNDLKKTQKIVDKPAQHQHVDQHDTDDEYYDTEPIKDIEDDIENNVPGPNTGRPGIDYPALAEIPQTSFTCKDQRYKGFFGDPETNCQVWHYCDLNGGQASFLCPNGTIFSQVALTCDWWFNVKCSSTAQLYVLNERLYKYILPFTPKFPEDYSGPLVDKYLALKFQEMEEKMRKQKKGKEENETENDEDEDEDEVDEDDIEENDNSSIDQHEPFQQFDQPTSEKSNPIQTIAPISHSLPVPIIPTRTTVETEKVEVIEIKTDGNSGHIIPGKQ